MIGLGIGLVVGSFVGGIGIAMFGGAFGVPAAFLLALAGVAIGHHLGVGQDKKGAALRPVNRDAGCG